VIQVGHYWIGPSYTEHVVDETRREYSYRGATVYVDIDHQTRRVEVFAYIDDGPLWFVGEFRGWGSRQRQKAQRLVDTWLETFMEVE